MIESKRIDTNSLKPYDLFVAWDFIRSCQLRCDYCFFDNNYLEERKPWFYTKIKKSLFKDKRVVQKTSIDIEALLRIIEEHRKTFLIQLIGGEPFLCDNIIEASRKITKSHYLSIVSNFVSPKVKDFLYIIEPNRVDKIYISCHFNELKKRNLEKKFIDNVLLCHDKGFNFSVSVVLHPAYYKEIDSWTKKLKDLNVELEYQGFRGVYRGQVYPDAYSNEDLRNYKLIDKPTDYYRKGQKCNAGYNMLVLNPEGQASSCYGLNDDRGSLSAGLSFLKETVTCPLEKCPCLLPLYQFELYRQALGIR